MGRRRSSKLNMYIGLTAGFFLASTILGHQALSSPSIPAHVVSITGPGEKAWMNALLDSLGAPRTAANIASLEHWKLRETVGWPPQDKDGNGNLFVVDNPMNTGRRCCGGTTINSAGIQSYPSLSAGLEATVITLHNGHYGDILGQLRKGNGLTSGASPGLLTWSGGAYAGV